MSGRVAVACVVMFGACLRGTPGPGLSAPLLTSSVDSSRVTPDYHVVEWIYRAGLQNEWQDYGWAPRSLGASAPARIDLAHWGGWIVAKPGLGGQFDALVFEIKGGAADGDFLEAHLDSSDRWAFPRVRITAAWRREARDGWTSVTVPMAELDPQGHPFDRVVLRAFRPLVTGTMLVDQMALVAGNGLAAPLPQKPPRSVAMAVRCGPQAPAISPMIYGIAFSALHDATDTHQWTLGASSRRWGGNPTSRYNWELDAWNTGNDWFFENVPTTSFRKFLEEDATHGLPSAVTVPLLGWVAKDATSMAFPSSRFGGQQRMDAARPLAGNGKSPDGVELPPGPPTMTSVPAPPELIKRWVATIAADQTMHRNVYEYILDNEPALWSSTHRDVHPEPLGYDELLDRTIRYGEAVREADPTARIAGPAAWGWPEYLYSAKDMVAGVWRRPDRRQHGDVPLLAWYLRKLHDYEAKTGKRILDVLDVHFYPQGPHLMGADEAVDAATAALRIRSTRSLWDPTYVDESWIHDTVALIPRLQKWIDENYPERSISIGEYNFGGETHMSGGLAVAEALGRFGQGGVGSAFMWTYPPPASPAYWAFRAYRNFDGKGGRFLDFSLGTTAGGETSLFASRDAQATHIVAIALNTSPDVPALARVDLGSCFLPKSCRVFVYTGGRNGFEAGPHDSCDGGSTMKVLLPAYSITVVDVERGS